MISICIPVYNFDVGELVEGLSAACSKVPEETEIILIDDASDDAFQKINSQLADRTTYIQLDENIGRAAIRNRFLGHAQHDYLLFLDCDSKLVSDQFLRKYIDAVGAYPNKLICGGRIYPESLPDKDHMLSWKYGRARESRTAAQRSANPNASFMTNNFLIPRSIFSDIRFDETIKTYGHEDTLFGFELKKKGVEIAHIANPVLNGDIETNAEYLRKTEEAIKNLRYLMEATERDPQLISDVSLLRVYYSSAFVRVFTGLLFPILKNRIRQNFLAGKVNLRAFDFYKLGILHQSLA